MSTTDKPIILTNHARLRMSQMQVKANAVMECILHPEISYSQSDREEGEIVFQKDRLAVAADVTSDNVIVMSVLVRTQEIYSRPDDSEFE